MDRQGGVRTSGSNNRKRGSGAGEGGNRSAAYGKENRPAGTEVVSYGDSGGTSRFFSTVPFVYQPKAGSDDRATVWVRGCAHGPDPHDPATAPADAADWDTGRACTDCGKPWVAYQHPTVKPSTDGSEGAGGASPLGGIMAHLIRLVTPEGGTVVDPYAGTGTTGVVAVREGFRAVVGEQSPAHVQMIRKRLAAPIQQGLFGLDG
jgi:site-specific DNA-methyltransferase (adenine-specific)